MTILTPQVKSTQAPHISVDPNVRGGVPCVGDGHWPIAHILEELASGITAGQIIQTHPDLTLADIQLALKAAAWVMRDPAIDWSALNLPGMLDFQEEMRAWQSLSDETLGGADDPPRD